jgi:hypothetical protein
VGIRKEFEKEKLLCGILIGAAASAEEVEKSMVRQFGPIDYESGLYPFSFTDYYTAEMGGGIRRFFVSFSTLIDPQRLPEIKIRTNEIENYFTVQEHRTVNIDPGMMNLSRLVLATTKNAPHRIPLQNGIYGEVTLVYRKKEYRELHWTYPDYRSEEYKRILTDIRDIYKQQLK